MELEWLCIQLSFLSSQEKSEICLDMCNGIWYYMQVRDWAHPALFARYCDEPGDCSGF